MNRNQRLARLKRNTSRLRVRVWRLADPFLETQGVEDHRRFFARTVKYFLDKEYWDDELIPWDPAQHENLIQMLGTFADQKLVRMVNTNNADVVIERSVAIPQFEGKRKKKKAHRQSKLIHRFARDIIKRIKMRFPSRTPGERRDRARMIATFTKLVKKKFIKEIKVPEVNPAWER